MSDKTTQHQWRVKVSGIPGTFNTFSGGAMEREATQAWSGGSPSYDHLTGPATYSNIEVSKDYRLSDEDWLVDWRKPGKVRRATVTVQQLDEDLVAVGKPRTYEDCVLVGLTDPETEAGAAGASQITLSFATNGPS